MTEPLDITKPIMTRDGRAVTDLKHVWDDEGGKFIQGVVGNESWIWLLSGAWASREGTPPQPQDLVYATRKKETAVTAELARKAKAHNDVAGMHRGRFDLAKSWVKVALRLCHEDGFDFDDVVKHARAAIAESIKIRMDGKYITRGGGIYESEPVRVVCVDGNDAKHPVVGFIGKDSDPTTWSITGRLRYYQDNTALDLIEIFDGENND